MKKSPRNFSHFSYSPQNNFESLGDKEKSVATRDSNLKNKGISIPSGVQHGKTPLPRKNNLYARPTEDTYYYCKGRGHISKTIPIKRVIVVTEEREEEEKRLGHAVENNEYAEVEFAEEESDVKVNFVLQITLLASKEEGKCNNLFKTHCSIKNKLCNLIVDSGNMENLVSQKLEDYLKLSTEPHENPYTLGWVSNASHV